MDLSAWIFAGVGEAWIETDHQRDTAPAIALTPSCGDKSAGRFARPAACVAASRLRDEDQVKELFDVVAPRCDHEGGTRRATGNAVGSRQRSIA